VVVGVDAGRYLSNILYAVFGTGCISNSVDSTILARGVGERLETVRGALPALAGCDRPYLRVREFVPLKLISPFP